MHSGKRLRCFTAVLLSLYCTPVLYRRTMPAVSSKPVVKWYAIRAPGKKPVCTNDWVDAVNARFNYHQGHSNAVLVYSEDDAKRFLLQGPFPEGTVQEVEGWWGGLPTLLRLVTVTLGALIVFCCIFTGVMYMETNLGCNEPLMALSPVCQALVSFRLLITQQTGALVQSTLTALLAFVAVLFAWAGKFIR